MLVALPPVVASRSAITNAKAIADIVCIDPDHVVVVDHAEDHRLGGG
jgi:hypothetical protein